MTGRSSFLQSPEPIEQIPVKPAVVDPLKSADTSPNKPVMTIETEDIERPDDMPEVAEVQTPTALTHGRREPEEEFFFLAILYFLSQYP